MRRATAERPHDTAVLFSGAVTSSQPRPRRPFLSHDSINQHFYNNNPAASTKE